MGRGDNLTILYPSGCREITEDLSPDELIRRLKTLAHTLQSMGQDDEAYKACADYQIRLLIGTVCPCRNTYHWPCTSQTSSSCLTPAGTCSCSLLAVSLTCCEYMHPMPRTKTPSKSRPCIQALLLPARESCLRQVLQYVL
ncbi:hypothetical protein HAZT_HAZT008102 [Hyalella azteca]|uniref:Uncharacterized protein n=1 Tax=Hyalella azteca TaxID=294128 RepID=A0A6A0H0B4_HYAAZ|nr:hypothetical protein HAZT_HAZT008102 [Hyalella azteca]